jgi:hypothetical protein
VQAIARMIGASPALQSDLEAQCKAMGVTFKLPICSVKTQWNLVYKMIDPLIDLWRPLNAVMLHVRPNEHAAYCAAFLHDRNMAFQNEELAHFVTLKMFLLPFYDATKRLSVGHRPTVHLVIPVFANLCYKLESICSDVALPSFLKNGAQVALAKLKKYQNCICRSDACIVATCETVFPSF